MTVEFPLAGNPSTDHLVAAVNHLKENMTTFSIVTGSFSPGTIPADGAVGVSGTVSGTTTADTVVLLRENVGFSQVFFTDARITATDTVNVIARNYSGAASNPGATIINFLLISGLAGP